MFETLSEKLQSVFKQLARRGKLSEADVDSALREVRLALLEADVHFNVVKEFLGRVKTRAVGAEVSRALAPAQQVIKIVHEELIATLGPGERLNLSGPKPRAIMLVGLQGSGKTTTAAKLAGWLMRQGERPVLVAADPYRPAAAAQLQTLGASLNVEVISGPEAPPDLCARALKSASDGGASVVIMDTAGRLQIDEALMAELSAIKGRTSPAEALLVADAMTGQEAVKIAGGFHKQVGLTGLVLTKADGDARGGAAISMRAVTGVPIKFLGVSEKLDGLEAFSPDRLAGRILGMGDMLGLIEKAEAALDFEQAQKAAEKLKSASFDFEDFLEQLRQVRKMGPIGQLLDMVPGMGQLAAQISPQDAERQMRRTEAMISSMTREERRSPEIMNASRKRRIAAGSGTTVQEVNILIKQFKDMQRLMKQMGKRGGMAQLSRMFR
ncbi:MAG: signal recognition particle protein [Chloroflexi bacterium]|nr:signal recognition particle protein [Chloroflexota bacterium]MBI3762020.1 signal recognition particle protein [Chloroflexota bacterium]